MDQSPSCSVTVLCGFLGAGKTTVLRHLLTQTEGEAWALVVNDVGSINIDARLMSQAVLENSASESGSGAEVVELGNGCVCCSNKDDLAETLCRLGAEGRFSRILIETSGVAEPRGIAQLFIQRNAFGRCVSDFARLEAMATLVDAADFEKRWNGGAAKQDQSGKTKDLSELLAEQVEIADLLIINKCDLADEETLKRIEDSLRGLNPHAEVLRTEQGQIPRESLLGRQRFDGAVTLGSARWLKELNSLAKTPTPKGRERVRSAVRAGPDYTTKYGLRSFTFQARSPFEIEKLRACLSSQLKGIVRAKGFLWIRERPDEMAFLSVAGGALRIDWPGYWWAAMIENGKVRAEERPPIIRALWQEPGGDRRQELVFIGVNYDEGEIRRSLESCLAIN
jgi:G3E family GTPase